MSLYPNPAKSILNIKIKDSQTIDKITITEMTGKMVFEQWYDNNPINVEKLASGMYIIEVSSGVEKWQSKFIKE
jgi:hypothetical protein